MLGQGRGTIWLRSASRVDALRAWAARRCALMVTVRGDRGMSTAEYAVGTIAACAFAGLLFKVVTSGEVQELLVGLIDRALKVAE
ncbi:DUF4244 domain-containing protein [Thermocatellispora tengchongensis]